MDRLERLELITMGLLEELVDVKQELTGLRQKNWELEELFRRKDDGPFREVFERDVKRRARQDMEREIERVKREMERRMKASQQVRPITGRPAYTQLLDDYGNRKKTP